MKYGVRCPNMNHGRINAPIKYCPMCGETVNRSAVGKCDPERHSYFRKNRNAFCQDCGKNLAAG